MLLTALLFFAAPAQAATAGVSAETWWVWPLALFIVCFLLGIVSVPAGVGGGVLFVPVVSGFFPFHMDFVRAAGLLVALASALSAGPTLLRCGLADLRLALPAVLLTSISSIAGVLFGLALPESTVQTALGVTVLGIVLLMILARPSNKANAAPGDALSRALGMQGIFHDTASGQDYPWQARRTLWGLFLFIGIGFLAGLFGMGAGWANVPVLNLVMNVPLKVSSGTSSLILSHSSAAWVYLNRGAVLPIIAVPSVIGMMLGARIGTWLLTRLKTATVRKLVIVLLFLTALRSLLKGLGIWG